jgi:urate oxidase
MSANLTANHYGKSDVRLTKVVRRGARHELFEFSVDIDLTGDFAASYTAGDNRKIVATDSMKNTVYVLAKENDFASAEAFAILLAEHFPRTYEQVAGTSITVRQTSWSRIALDGKPHDHAFFSGGNELHTAKAAVAARGQAPVVTGGITDLLVLKTTNSAFKDFVTDRYRTLKDADDRIFATSVTATWDYIDSKADFVTAHERLRSAMLRVFATHMSYAVQETMYEMGKAALDAAPEIKRIVLRLPNKHRIPFNLQPFGLENKNEIFVWTDEPFGDISATIERQ